MALWVPLFRAPPARRAIHEKRRLQPPSHQSINQPIVFVALAFVQGAPRSHRRRGMYTAVIPSDSRVFMAYYIGAQAKDGDYADYEPPTRC